MWYKRGNYKINDMILGKILESRYKNDKTKAKPERLKHLQWSWLCTGISDAYGNGGSNPVSNIYELRLSLHIFFYILLYTCSTLNHKTLENEPKISVGVYVPFK